MKEALMVYPLKPLSFINGISSDKMNLHSEILI